jgi:hypothetical protein
MKNECLIRACSIGSARENPAAKAAELTWNRVDNNLFSTAEFSFDYLTKEVFGAISRPG